MPLCALRLFPARPSRPIRSRMATARRFALAVESLEAREVLSLAFSFTYSDPSNALAAYQPQLGMNLQAAAQALGQALDGKGTVDVQVTANPVSGSVIASATPIQVNIGTASLPQGTVNVYEALPEYEATHGGSDLNGSSPDMLLNINPNYLSPRPSSTPPGRS